MRCGQCTYHADDINEFTKVDGGVGGFSWLCAGCFGAFESIEVGDKPAGRKFDGDKLRYDLIPTEYTLAAARILTFGAKKYDANNWQQLEGFKERYTAALYRHLEAWRGGEDNDDESGYLHLEHAACNIAFLLWGANNGKLEQNNA